MKSTHENFESFDSLNRLGLIETFYDLGGSMDVGFTSRGDARVVDAKLDSGDYLTDFAFRFVNARRAPAVTIEGQATDVK